MNDTLPPLPEPAVRETYATASNTTSVRKGYEMGGYVKSPDLYTADQMRSYAAAALAAAVAEPVATGFKLVPLEPTPEMAKAGCYRYCATFVKDYKAMIAAAPAAPPQRDRCWACGNTGSVTTSSNGSGLIKVPCEDCAPKETT